MKIRAEFLTILFLSLLLSCNKEEDNSSNIISNDDFVSAINKMDKTTMVYYNDLFIGEIGDYVSRIIFAFHDSGIYYDTVNNNFAGKGSIFLTYYSCPKTDTILTEGIYNYDIYIDSTFQYRGGGLFKNIDYDNLIYDDKDLAVNLDGNIIVSKINDEYTLDFAFELEPYIDLDNDITDSTKRFEVNKTYKRKVDVYYNDPDYE